METCVSKKIKINKNFLKRWDGLGVVVHAFYPSTGEAEASRSQGQPGLHSSSRPARATQQDPDSYWSELLSVCVLFSQLQSPLSLSVLQSLYHWGFACSAFAFCVWPCPFPVLHIADVAPSTLSWTLHGNTGSGTLCPHPLFLPSFSYFLAFPSSKLCCFFLLFFYCSF